MSSVEIKQEVLNWIAEGCNYNQGVELYRMYGKNMMLKRDFSGHQTRYATKIVVELCKSVGLDYGEFLIDRNINNEVKVFNEVKDFKHVPFSMEQIMKQIENGELDNIEPMHIQQYPTTIRRVISEYAELFQERSKTHRIMTEMPEGNSQALKTKRGELFDMVKGLGIRLEYLYDIRTVYDQSGFVPTDDEIWPAPKAKVITELPDDMEQLRKMKKNQQSANTKDQSMLDYQSEKQGTAKNTMPTGPKRMKLENRIKARLKMIEEIEYKLIKVN